MIIGFEKFLLFSILFPWLKDKISFLLFIISFLIFVIIERDEGCG